MMGKVLRRLLFLTLGSGAVAGGSTLLSGLLPDTSRVGFGVILISVGSSWLTIGVIAVLGFGPFDDWFNAKD